MDENTNNNKEQENPNKHLNAVVSELVEIRKLIENTLPKPPTSFLQKAHVRLHAVIKYVGLPALLLAAIVPVYEISVKLLDYRNREYIQKTYVSYANVLFDKGEYKRAESVLSSLNNAKSLDALTQYTKSKILLETAYRNGRSYYEAEDTTNILINLHNNRPALFPAFGGDNEVRSLQLRLIDILTQRTAYEEALEELANLSTITDGSNSELTSDEISIRKGKIYVYQHKYDLAEPLLRESIDNIQSISNPPPSLLGQAYHALGTMNVFTGELDSALIHFSNAEKLFKKSNDRHGLLRTFANQAMAHSGNMDWNSAQSSRLKQIRIARELQDDLAIANAQLGLSVVERRMGRLDEALRLAKEAEIGFESLANSLGLATAYHNQANTYLYSDKYAKAIYFARRGLAIFEETRDPRGVAAALGIIGEAGRNLDDYEEAIYGLLGSIALKRHTGYSKTKDGKRDVVIQARHLKNIINRVGNEKYLNIMNDAKDSLEKTRVRLEIDKLDYDFDN